VNTWEEANQVLQHFAKLYAGKFGENKAKDWKDKVERQAADFIFNRVARPLWNRVNGVWDSITGSGHDLVGRKAHYPQFSGMVKKQKTKISPKIRAAMQRIGPQLAAIAKRGRTGKARGRQPKGMTFRSVSDGLSHNDVITNDSAVRDHFKRRTEKLSNISGTAAFAMQAALYLNPGNSTLFPLFSNTAVNYEEYICHFLEFRIGTEAYTSVNSTGSAGKVIMATNFDINDVQFTSDQQMENYQGMRKAPPFRSFSHDVIRAHKSRKGNDLALKNYFVYPSANLSGPNNNGADKFYDMGLFQLATQNNAVTSEIGELYVTYEFTMIRPKQNQNGQFIQAHIEEGAAGTATAASPLGTAGGLIRPGSSIPVTATLTGFVLPVTGNYLITGSWLSSVGLSSAPTITGGANCSPLDIFRAGAAAGATANVSFVGVVTLAYVVTAPGTGADNTFTIGGLGSLANGNADVFITQVSSGLTFMRDRVEAKQELRLERIERYLKQLAVFVDGEDEKGDWHIDPRILRSIDANRTTSHLSSDDDIDYREALPPGGPVLRLGEVTPKVRPSPGKQPGWFSKTSLLP